VPWFPVLTDKYGCQVEVASKVKRQTPNTVVVPGSATDTPVIDPKDPAAHYLSVPAACQSTLASSSRDTSAGGLSGGAWVAIALAVIIGGIVMLLVVFLTYMYKSNKSVRFESI